MPQQQIVPKSIINRRSFFWKYFMLPIAFLIGACEKPITDTEAAENTPTSPPSAKTGQPQTLPPTPACTDKGTQPQTEGPYYKPRSPERTSLREAGLSGTTLIVTGRVLSTTCQPIARALLDFWHADSNGGYDNTGFKLRGHQYTDDQGNYRLETILPGEYPGRTRHIHVKVQAPGQPVLTTQLYFPGEARNNSDGIFSSQLLMRTQKTPNGQQATFDFVLDKNGVAET